MSTQARIVIGILLCAGLAGSVGAVQSLRRARANQSASPPDTAGASSSDAAAEARLRALENRLENQEARVSLLEERLRSAESELARRPAGSESDAALLAEMRAQIAKLMESATLTNALAGMVDSGELDRLKKRYELRQREYWQKQEPKPSAELAAEGAAKLAEAVDNVYDALRASNGDPADVQKRMTDALSKLEFERAGQVTIVDAQGNYVFHKAGLTGSSHFYKDVNGKYPYEGVLHSTSGSGTSAYYDFLADDKAREVMLSYKQIPELGWWVLVEGNEWKAMHSPD